MDNWLYSAKRQCVRASCWVRAILPLQKREKEISAVHAVTEVLHWWCSLLQTGATTRLQEESRWMGWNRRHRETERCAVGARSQGKPKSNREVCKKESWVQAVWKSRYCSAVTLMPTWFREKYFFLSQINPFNDLTVNDWLCLPPHPRLPKLFLDKICSFSGQVGAVRRTMISLLYAS